MKGKKLTCGILIVLIVVIIIYRRDSESIHVSGVLDQVSIREERREQPRIAITFDDGPSMVEGTTEMLLDGLKERGVKASFFLLGKQVEEAPELVRRMYEEGHLIGNHSYSHTNLAQVSIGEAVQELEETNDRIEDVTGETVWFVRPPFGDWSRELEEKIPMMTVMWSVDPLDWNTTNVNAIINKVVTETEENDIILLHDSFPTSVQAALQIVDRLQEEGYEFVTVDELLMN